SETRRRRPIGAESDGQRTHVRLWAPGRRSAEAMEDGGERGTPLDPEPGGYFSGWIEGGPGLRYRFRLDGEAALLPDPASRFQPDGPHGPSMVVDPHAFAWSD